MSHVWRPRGAGGSAKSAAQFSAAPSWSPYARAMPAARGSTPSDSGSRMGRVIDAGKPSSSSSGPLPSEPFEKAPRLARRSTAPAVIRRKRARSDDRQDRFKKHQGSAGEFLRKQKVSSATQEKYTALAKQFYSEEKLKRSDDVALL